MSNYKCPKCGGLQIAVERRPDGDAICADCRHRGPATEFYSVELAQKLVDNKRKREKTERMRNAAPAMYEALKACAEFIHYYDQEHSIGDGKVLEQAIAALRAADGGE
jgi:uncharacterized Zn finger protein (UPF0148 family)